MYWYQYINISTVIVNDSMEIHRQVTLHYNAEERHLSVQVHGYRIKVHTKSIFAISEL